MNTPLTESIEIESLPPKIIDHHQHELLLEKLLPLEISATLEEDYSSIQ
jgi:hypothetical protein